jgi:hypothetical protein
MHRSLGASLAALPALALLLAPSSAPAFCGFYVGGAGAKMFNNATQVVLLRDGTRTVLSMQNNYQGPPERFAMVVPVPVVLQKENVKTLRRDVFEHIDQLSSPRLVEYWEQDPCPGPRGEGYGLGAGAMAGAMMPSKSAPGPEKARDRVRIEAQFAVGEYEVVVLSADDALSLDTWLKQNNYNIPEGAEPILRPYVQGGMKFFVAKVDPAKVKFENGMATLSPLRFFYDSELFGLPVRLGLLNSGGTQDLIVNILARGKRYEAANYPNVAIPTNLDVLAKVKPTFGAFYAALFDNTVRKHPRAVVTEYAWSSGSCDPCPGPPLDPAEVETLGGDVSSAPAASSSSGAGSQGRGRRRQPASDWVLTRLHTRYTREALGEDLVFREASAITGGRETEDDKGRLETTVKSASFNNFQARYAIRYRWTGPIACQNPQRGVWGDPPGGGEWIHPATNLAFAPRGGFALGGTITRGSIDAFALSGAEKVASTIPIGILAAPAASAGPDPDQDGPSAPSEPSPDPIADEPPPQPQPQPPPPVMPPAKGGCAGCAVGTGDQGVAMAALAGVAALGLLGQRRRRR